jgi:hypothetical protein
MKILRAELGWVEKFWVGLGLRKMTHVQLCMHVVKCDELGGLRLTSPQVYETCELVVENLTEGVEPPGNCHTGLRLRN